jgi:hypothetical protein
MSEGRSQGRSEAVIKTPQCEETAPDSYDYDDWRIEVLNKLLAGPVHEMLKSRIFVDEQSKKEAHLAALRQLIDEKDPRVMAFCVDELRRRGLLFGDD